MRKKLRVFISSPGDVPDERLWADLIVDKLSQDYGRFVTLESYRWEHEPMLASGHFEDAVEPPSRFDIVILILWSRLGTPLPVKTGAREYHGIDGRAPVTGTEWEYEEALRAARDRGAPDILAFRNISPALINTRDHDARVKSLEQLDALDAFWKRHFADRGLFLAAFEEYLTLEDFTDRLERSLRKLVERRISSVDGGPVEQAPIWLGAPFRGLQSYEIEHAAIYFGRDGIIAKAAESLAARARAGTAFLLLSGPSGSGKSSLVKAALVPRLMKPLRIQGTEFLRHVIMRPGDGGNDVILGLVEALVLGSAKKAIGLPEMLAPGRGASDLARLVRAAPEALDFAVTGALARLTEMCRADGKLLAFEQAKLILVVDQLEELFSREAIGPQDRALFIQLLGRLAASGAVWVIATLRADFWHRAAEIAELVTLAQGQGRLDLPSPSPAELSTMIRKPAQAAGLTFEAHAVTGLGLDLVLSERAAAEPGVLPLLSFTLDALYAEDVLKNGGNQLTFASYEALGGLEGAIATRAEQVVAGLRSDAQAELPRVLRALATISAGAAETPVARPARLSAFGEGTAARDLIDALTAARLLVASSEGRLPVVRVAHEALISHWRRARGQLANDRRDLETRALIEHQQTRWLAAAGRQRNQLLLRDPDLANAIDLAERWGGEIDPATRIFIAASRRRARLRYRLTAAAAIVFAVVAVGAGVAADQALRAQRVAEAERARAERTLTAATRTADSLIFDLAQRFRDAMGIPAAFVNDILERALALQRALSSSGEVPAELRMSEADALAEISQTLLVQGNSAAALETADRARKLLEALVAEQPDNPHFQHDLTVAYERIGDALDVAGRYEEALAAYRSSLAIRRKLVERDPDNETWQRDLSINHVKIGDILMEQGKLEEALESYNASLAIAQDPARSRSGGVNWPNELAVAHERIGDVLLTQGKNAPALAAYRRSLELRQELAARNPGDARWQRDLSIGFARVADALAADGKLEDSLVMHRRAIDIRRKLADTDPGNAQWQRDLAIGNLRMGDVLKELDRIDEALAAFRQSLAIADRLAAGDNGNVSWQHDLSVSCERIGDMLQLQENYEGALPLYRRSAEVRRRLVELDPENAQWQLDLAISHSRIGDVLVAQQKSADALNLYRTSLAIVQAARPSNAASSNWQRALVSASGRVGATLLDLARNEEGLAVLDDLIAALPADGDARWERARAELLADRAPAAVADMLAAVRLKPGNHYFVIWLHISRWRAGQPDGEELAANAEALDGGKWPWPVVALFLRTVDGEALGAAAHAAGSPRKQREQACEAEFYRAYYLLERGSDDEGRGFLQAALSSCPKNFVEFQAAKLELRRMK